LDADGEGIRDQFGDASGLVDSDVAKDDIGNVGGKSEEVLTDGSNTRVLMVEAGDECGRVAAKVCLVVEGIHRVEEALVDVEDLFDESGAVFENETSLNGSSGQHVEEF